MSVHYYNGQYYDVGTGYEGLTQGLPSQGRVRIPNVGYGTPISPPPNQGASGNNIPQVGNNPFASASSGGVSGTLQPFVNRNTSLANNALYGGLLGYQPQQLMAGNAGGTPVSPQPPQWHLPSAIPTPNQGQVGLLGNLSNIPAQGIFNRRSWMEA